MYINIYPANRPEVKKISQQAESRLFKAKKNIMHQVQSQLVVEFSQTICLHHRTPHHTPLRSYSSLQYRQFTCYDF